MYVNVSINVINKNKSVTENLIWSQPDVPMTRVARDQRYVKIHMHPFTQGQLPPNSDSNAESNWRYPNLLSRWCIITVNSLKS